MVTLRIGELILPQFKGALMGLKGQEMGFDTAFKVNALIKKIENKILEVEELKFSLLKKYCQVDEKGNFVENIGPNGNPIRGSVVPIEETVEEFKQKFAELVNTKVEFDVPKIDISKLKDTRITMNDLEFLEPFLEEKPNLSLV